MRTKVYIVTAYRYGDIEAHCYHLGVFQDKQTAIKVADSHCDYRGGKYSCVVEECFFNHFFNEQEGYINEVYTAKSFYQMDDDEIDEWSLKIIKGKKSIPVEEFSLTGFFGLPQKVEKIEIKFKDSTIEKNILDE